MPITLLYHDVLGEDAGESGFPGASAGLYKLSQREFADHLTSIREAVGVESVGLLRAGEARPSVLLAFDDGGSSALRIADALEAHGWRGYFFIASGYTGTPGFLDRAGVRELHTRGHVVGSHSVTHPLPMSALPRARILAEWRDSVEDLASMIGAPVDCASVPGGFFNRTVAETAVEAGIEMLFNSEPVSGIRMLGSCQILGRYSVQQRTGAAKAAAMARGDWMPRARQFALWNAKKLAKRAGGSQWLRFREAVIERRTSR